MEIGWLLDDGTMCIGVKAGNLVCVTYTDPCAIRFARHCDAENMQRVIARWGFILIAKRFQPVEHMWGSEAPAYIDRRSIQMDGTNAAIFDISTGRRLA